MRALLVKTIGFGPEVDPEVKVIRASFLPPKMFLGTRPRYFSATLVICFLPSQNPSRAEGSRFSIWFSSGPALSTVLPSRLITCLTELASCFRALIRLLLYL